MKFHSTRSLRSKTSASAKLFSLMTAMPLFAGSALFAQNTTWTNNATGNTTWSTTTNWNTGTAPLSDTATVVNFFTGATLPAASAVIANNDIANPIVLNQLNLQGSGPASGAAANLTINGNGIAFDGVNAQLNANPLYSSGGGFNVTLASPLTFNTATAINFGNGGGIITTSGVWNGSGNVTFTGSLLNRPLTLTANSTNFSGDLTVVGTNSIVALNGQATQILGPNTSTTQSVIIGNGAGVTRDYGNAAFTNLQNFIVNGNGNVGSGNAALSVQRIGFGNGAIGGLAINSNSTVRVQVETTGEARGLSLSRGLVGTGDLTKIGNGYLLTNALAGNVTWGGTSYSLFSGNITINDGVIQTPAVSNTLGSGTTQTVLVNNGAGFLHGSGDNAWVNPQNFVLNGMGTGYIINAGGYAAYTTQNAGFGSQNAGSLSIQSDSNVAVNRSGGRGNSGLTVSRGLFGPGNLIISNLYGNTVGPMYVGNATTANVTTSVGNFDRFSGKVVINNGILITTASGALGDSTNGQVYLSGLGGFGTTGIALNPVNQGFLGRIENLGTTSGTLLLAANNSNDLDFSSAPNLRLGAIAASNSNSSSGYTYSGNLTAGANGYRLGGAGGGILTVSSNLTGSNALNVGGAVTLTGTGNTFNGGITIAGIQTNSEFAARLNYTNGTGVLPSANNLTFAGIGGTFAYSTPVNTTDTSQTLGNLTFSEGVGSVTATTGNSTVFGNSTLTFSGLARTSGAVGTLQTVNGANGTSNKIVITGLATGFVDKGLFFNSSNYTYNDAAGFLRAPVYGTDSGFVTIGSTASVASATHQQISGNITAQNTATFTTLRLNGNAPLNIASGQTVTTDSILKAGGTAVTIAGPGVLQASAGGELVVNSVDGLTIGSSILNNGNSSLTKTGAGTLTLTGTATNYSGGTTVNQGIFLIGSTAAISSTGPISITGGTLQLNGNKTVGDVTLKNGLITGVIGGSGLVPSVLTATSYALQNGGVNTVLAGPGAVTKSTEGYVYLSANNTYSGGTTVSAGSIALIGQGTFGTGTLTISGGRVDLGGKTITNTLGPISSGGSIHRGTIINNGGTYELQNGTITAVLSGTNGLNKTTAGTLTLTGNNSYTGPTTLTSGNLILGASSLPGGGLGTSRVVLSSGTTLDVSGVTASTVTLSGGLGGNGTVNATGKNLLVAGTFTPGALSITGNLSFDPSTLTTFVASTTPGVSTALAVTGSVTNSGNLTISPASGFTFGGNQSFTFVTASGGITPGYSAVTVNAVPLTQAPAGVWSVTDSGLIYTYTENTATLTVASAVVYSPLQLWRNDKFGTYENSGSAADTFDADGDGISNLMEYALNGNPNVADTSILPQITGTGPLKLTFYRNGDANITYIVEARDDLATGSWTSIYNSFGTTYTPGLFEVADPGPVVGNKRFLRLRVTAP